MWKSRRKFQTNYEYNGIDSLVDYLGVKITRTLGKIKAIQEGEGIISRGVIFFRQSVI